VVAFRRPSNGRELLSGLCSSRNISINNFLSFIPNGVGGLGTVGSTNIVQEVKGISEGKATYRSLILSVGLFSIDRVWVSF
jgi:hypothetical protein